MKKHIIFIIVLIITTLQADKLNFNITNYTYNTINISQIIIEDTNGSNIILVDNNLSTTIDNNLSSIDVVYDHNYSIIFKTSNSGIYRYNFTDKLSYISSIQVDTLNLKESNNTFTFDASRINFIQEKLYDTISIGEGHTLALKSNGELWAWGNNEFGQLGDQSNISTHKAVKVGDNNYSSISVGQNHSVALDTNGYLYTWGNNLLGQLGVGNTIGSSYPTKVGSDTYISISAKGNYTLAVKSDGTLWATGLNDHYQLGLNNTTTQNILTQIGSDTNWKTIASGYNHTLAIKTDGSLYSWGYNISGQLGTGDNVEQTTPIRIGSDTNWKDIDVGFAHSIAIKDNGTIYSWGYNGDGQLGLGDNDNRNTPTQIGNATNWVKAKAGINFTILLTSDARVYTFGGNQFSQLGQYNLISYNEPQELNSEMNSYTDIFAGGYSSAFSSDIGATLTNGKNDFGQLGHESYNKFNLTNIDSYSLYTKISTSATHSLAINEDGYLKGWGQNNYGVLGTSNENNFITPTNINYDTNWNDVRTSPFHTLALKNDGSLYSWGLNTSGQLGVNTNDNNSTPQQIGSETIWTSKFDVGNYHSIAIKSDNTLWVWGQNDYGQLGDETTNSSAIPKQIGIDNNWTKVSAGAFHSLAIKSDGSLWASGQNDYGQLCNNTFDNNTTLKLINNDNWSDISGGLDFTVAIKSDGTLWSCGNNTFGQLGDGSNDTNATLHQIGNDTNWIKVKASTNYTLALKSDGTLWGWGNNISSSSLFNKINTNTPIQISSLSSWSDISVADTFFMAKTNEDATYAVGSNDFGQLGKFWITTPTSIEDVLKVETYNDEALEGKTYNVQLIDEDGNIYSSINNNIFFIQYDHNYTMSIELDNSQYWYDFTNHTFYPYETNSSLYVEDTSMGYEIPSTYIDILDSKPNKPTNLTAQFLDNSIHLNWDDNSSNEKGFNILRNGIEINNTIMQNSTSFIDYDISSDTNYSYVVQVDNSFGTNNSIEVNITTPYFIEVKSNSNVNITNINKPITQNEYEENDTLSKTTPLDIYWINSYINNNDGIQTRNTYSNRIIITQNENIIDSEKEYQNNNIIKSYTKQNERYEVQNDNSIQIFDNNSTTAKFEVKFIEELNNTQLQDIYLSWNMDVNFSTKAKGTKLFTKNLKEELESHNTYSDTYEYTSISTFINEHNLSSQKSFMTNDINNSRALVFENNSSHILIEIDTTNGTVLNTNAGSWERITDTKSYNYYIDGIKLTGTTNDMITLNITDTKGYNFNTSFILASHSNVINWAELRVLNSMQEEIVLNSYAVNELAQIIFDNNDTQVFNNTQIAFNKLFEIRTDEERYKNNNITFDELNQIFTLTADKKSNLDSRAGIKSYSKYKNTAQVIADINLSESTTGYNKGAMWVVFEDVNISETNDINITNNKANIYAGINIKDDKINTWVTIYDENWTQRWNFDNLADYNNTIYTSLNQELINKRLKLNIKLQNNILYFSTYDENNNTIGNILEYNNTKINFDSIDKTELRASIDNNDDSDSITTMQVYGFTTNNLPVLSQIDDINLIEDFNTTIIPLAISDTDADLLDINYTISNEIIDINIINNNIVLNAISNASGITTVTINISDGYETISQSFDINIISKDLSNSVFQDWISEYGIESRVSDCDDCSEKIDIGFTFSIFGQSFSELTLSSNGYLIFNDELDDYEYDASTYNNGWDWTSDGNYPIIAPLWTDLYPGAYGSVHYNTIGDAPNRKLVISYKYVEHYNQTTLRNTFQTILYENGDIQFSYLNIDFNERNSSYDRALVGISNGNGTVYSTGEGISYDEGTLDNKLLYFQLIEDENSYKVYGLDINSTIILQDKFTLNLINLDLEENNITSISIIDVNNSNEVLLSNNIINGNQIIYNSEVNLDNSFKLKFISNNSNQQRNWWFNFSDGNLYDNDTNGHFISTFNDISNVLTVNLSNDTFIHIDHPPVISQINDINITEDSDNFIIPINVSDEDTDDITLSLSLSDSTKAEIYIDYNNSTIVVNPYENQYGTITIELNATANGQSTIGVFIIHIEPTNDAPNILTTLANISEDPDFGSIIVDLNITDIDGDQLKITLDYNTSLVDINSSSINEWLDQATYSSPIELNITSKDNIFGNTNVVLTLTDGDKNVSTTFNIDISNIDIITLQTGWNFISFPSTNVICDNSIQSATSFLTNICNQEYSLNSIFNNTSIKMLFKFIGNNWAYWDNENNNKQYQIDKFTSLTAKEGFVLRTTKDINISVPKAISNNLNEFVNINRDGWYLVGVNEDKTADNIASLIHSQANQSRSLQYMWVYRDGTWYIHDRTQSISDSFNSVKKDESFWIYVEE